ncbi:hypothetical protein D3C81_2071430 [compost metagenome]
MGAPSGVPPAEMASTMAITRPRMAGAVDSCTLLLTLVVNVCAAMPMTTSIMPNSQ